MAYPLAEQYEHGKKKLKPTGKPLFTPEKEQFIKGVQEVVKTKPAQAVLQSSPIKALGGALRYVGYVSERVTGYYKDRAVDRPVSLEGMIGLGLYGLEGLDKGVRAGARALNVDEDVASFGKDVVIDAVTGKLAPKVLSAATKIPPTPPTPKPQLAYAVANSGGSVKLNFNQPRVDVPEVPQVMPLTVTERIAEGVVQDIAKSPQFAKQVSRWEERWKTAHDRLDKWLAETEAPPKIIARNIKKSTAEAYGSVSTGMARLEDMFDEYFYKRMASEGKERHHLFPKAESYQFVKRLKQMIDDGVADMDDMVNLFLYAEDAGTVMGNRKANMLLMEKLKEHGPLHRMRETTEGALGLKMEPKTEDLFAKLSEAKNADELMDMFDEYLQLNIKPSKRAAFEQTMKKEREFLNVMKPTLSESQRRRL
jgi:hypothetical protein